MTDVDHRRLATDLFNATWDYLDRAERSSDDDAAMLGAALASWHHWRQVGEPKNFAISDWQVARVLAVLGEPALARRYGEMSLHWASEHDLPPFYIAYAHEAIARAAHAAVDAADRDAHLALGRAAAAQVHGEDDRATVLADLDSLCG